MEDHIRLDHDETNALLRCLLRAVDVGRSTGNLDLVAMGEELADLIIDKWFPKGDPDE